MMEERKGDFIITHHRKRFYPLDPRADDVDIRDIAHALSNICRFTGHVEHHYSVAQHSVLCCKTASRMNYTNDVQLLALLHDAAEAYVNDMARPVKKHLPNYSEIESGVLEVILQKYGVWPFSESQWDLVRDIDDKMLALEGNKLLDSQFWNPPFEHHYPLSISITVEEWTPQKAKTEFLQMFYYTTSMVFIEREKAKGAESHGTANG